MKPSVKCKQGFNKFYIIFSHPHTLSHAHTLTSTYDNRRCGDSSQNQLNFTILIHVVKIFILVCCIFFLKVSADVFIHLQVKQKLVYLKTCQIWLWIYISVQNSKWGKPLRLSEIRARREATSQPECRGIPPLTVLERSEVEPEFEVQTWFPKGGDTAVEGDLIWSDRPKGTSAQRR